MEEAKTSAKGGRSTHRGKSGRGRPKPSVRRGARRAVPRSFKGSPPSRAELARLSNELQWRRPPREAPVAPPAVAPRHLNVLMVGWEYPPHHTGGLGVHCYEICRELGRMGHKVTFLTPFHGPFTPTEGVTFRWPGGPGTPEDFPYAYETVSGPSERFDRSLTDYNRWVADFAPEETPDIVHVHDWFGTTGAVALSQRLKRPLVMTIHSTEYDRTLGHPGRDLLDREQLGLTAANRVIAVSRHLKLQLVERYGIPAEKVRVIYNAVRPPERLIHLERAGPIVLYLGRLAAMKGVDTFLRAAARAAPLVPDATFVVAGEGPEYPYLLTLAAHLELSDRVLFLGKVTDEERTVLLASTSVFVLPSVVEPFGIVALEAMSAGVPTIVSKTSGVAEITEETFAVDFWDIDEFASRIVELLQYPELRSMMGRRGRWEAIRSGWAERALETVGVYGELLAGRSGGP